MLSMNIGWDFLWSVPAGKVGAAVEKVAGGIYESQTAAAI